MDESIISPVQKHDKYERTKMTLNNENLKITFEI